jgi:hypothetical protein
MPKKRVVASLVGNFSPVKRRTAILVRRVRHRRGEMGEELNSRARVHIRFVQDSWWGGQQWCTILKDRGAVQLEEAGMIGIFIFLSVTHLDRRVSVGIQVRRGVLSRMTRMPLE